MPKITNGHSKDHRPDLKQFVISMLCVGGNVPIFGKNEDGNSSDKKTNNAVLSRISERMAKHGVNPGAFIYIADSAMVTKDNLKGISKNSIKPRWQRCKAAQNAHLPHVNCAFSHLCALPSLA